MLNSLPIDFICVGAAKSGTTWLWQMLKQHPQIYTPAEKELNYFNPYHSVYFEKPNPNYFKKKEWYHSYFSKARSNQIKGEITSTYLKFTDTAKKIYNYNPSIKIITILRHPVDRAWSQHQFLRSRGYRIDKDFIKAFKDYPELLNSGLYYQQLKPYYENLRKGQIQVLSFDELRDNPMSMLTKVYSFLGVEDFIPDGIDDKVNPTMKIVSEKKHQFISVVHRKIEQNRITNAIARKIGLLGLFIKWYNQNLSKEHLERLSEADYRKLYEFFVTDLDQLKRIVPKTFDHW